MFAAKLMLVCIGTGTAGDLSMLSAKQFWPAQKDNRPINPLTGKRVDLPVYAPAQAFVVASNDLKSVPPDLAKYTRYLSFYNFPGLKDRQEASRVLSGHLNHLTRQSEIIPLKVTEGFWLARINLLDYGWTKDLWDQLADSDPYFHVQVITFETAPSDNPKDPKQVPKRVKTIKGVLAPWLSADKVQKETLDYVVQQTESSCPVLRADWFFNYTAAQEGRKPGYYDFLGIKDEATFQRIIGFDKKLAEDFGRELRASVAISGVTLQPRALSRHNTLGGGYWRSFDFKLATDKANPLRILGADIEKEHDASEQFGHLPNGMWATGLFDKNGKVQNAAPDFIASDHLSKSNDRRVHVNVSCIRCHTNGGLQDIDDWTRNLIQPPLKLESADYNEVVKLRQQYLRGLGSSLDKDRKVFAEAVKEATGYSTAEYAKAYGDMWERYEDAKISVEWAANDVGVNVNDFKDYLVKYLKATNNLDLVLSVFVLEGPRQRSISIRQWEEAFPLAMLAVKGYIPIPGGKQP